MQHASLTSTDLQTALTPAQAATLHRLRDDYARSRKDPAALRSITGALDAIGDGGREIVHRIVIGQGNGPETVDAVASRLSLPRTAVIAALQNGLDALAGATAAA